MGVAVGHYVDAVHFFRCHGGKVAAPFVGLDQHFVGDDVQFFLHLALHVLTVRRSQHAAQCALVDGLADAFACACHHFKQQPQMRRNVAFGALLLDQVARQGNFGGHTDLFGFRNDLSQTKRGKRLLARHCSNLPSPQRGRWLRVQHCGRARPACSSGPGHAPAWRPLAG